MTIIAAVSGTDGVWVGSDSHFEANSRVIPSGGPKWQVSPDGQWAIGGSGESTFDGILFSDPDFDPETMLWPKTGGEDGLKILMGALRRRLDAAAQPRVDDDQVTRCYRYAPLVAWAGGGIWRLNSTLYTFDPPYESCGYEFNACGSGEEFALGAMWEACGAETGRASSVLHSGLAAAVQFSAGCNEPVLLRKLGDSGDDWQEGIFATC